MFLTLTVFENSKKHVLLGITLNGQIVAKLLVIKGFLVYVLEISLGRAQLSELGEHLSVIDTLESIFPCRAELLVSLWQIINEELINEAHIVHCIVTNQGLLGLNEQLDDLGEAKLMIEELLSISF